MSKTLFLFIESNNVDLYINVLMHCVHHENIEEIYFVGDKQSVNKTYELSLLVSRIYKEVDKLIESGEVEARELERKQYTALKAILPRNLQKYTIPIILSLPHLAIAEIRKRLDRLEQAIIDISGCSKHVSGDVLMAFMAQGFDNICHFALNDLLYSDEWRRSGKRKIYHNLFDPDGIAYYEYVNFSMSTPTRESIEHLRKQKQLVRFFFVLSALLLLGVIIFLFRQQDSLAQIIAIGGLLAVLLGLLEDGWSVFDRFYKNRT